MTSHNLRNLLLGALALTTVGETLAAQSYAVFLFDRSGSMATVRPGSGNTRCRDSELEAMIDLETVFLFGGPGTTVRILEFNSDIPGNVNEVGEFTSVTAAKNAVDSGLTPCSFGPLTPLADAICFSAQVLVGQSAPFKYLYTYSDGDENNSSGPCNGPSDADGLGNCASDLTLGTGVPFDAGSWQARACANIDATGAIVNAKAFDSFSLIDRFPFLRSLVRQSGGVFVEIADTAQSLPGNSFQNPGFGSCEGTRGARPGLSFAGVARPGGTFTIAVQSPSPRDNLLLLGAIGNARPIDLTQIGAPGCGAAVTRGLLLARGGLPFYPVQIPRDRALIGARLFTQGVALGQYNALGILTTGLSVINVQQ